MDSQSTPRITAPYLDRYVGRNVTIVGRVDQLRGEEATIDADGHIKAYLNRVCWQPAPPNLFDFPHLPHHCVIVIRPALCGPPSRL